MNSHGNYVGATANSSFISPFGLGWSCTRCSKLGVSHTEGKDYFSPPDMNSYLSQAMNVAGSNQESFHNSVCTAL